MRAVYEILITFDKASSLSKLSTKMSQNETDYHQTRFCVKACDLCLYCRHPPKHCYHNITVIFLVFQLQAVFIGMWCISIHKSIDIVFLIFNDNLLSIFVYKSLHLQLATSQGLALIYIQLVVWAYLVVVMDYKVKPNEVFRRLGLLFKCNTLYYLLTNQWFLHPYI